MPWRRVLLEGDAAELSNTPPQNVIKQTAAQGTATEASRDDHLHDVTVASPGAAVDGQAAAEGSATSLVRSDHRHALGPLAAAVNCGQQELQRMVFQNLVTASAPDSGSEAVGQAWFDTTVDRPKVWCAA